MSFSSLTKEELIRLPLSKSCCVMSELSALVQTSGSLQLRGGGRVRVAFRVENAGLARRIFQLLRAGLDLTPRLHFVQHTRLGGRRTCVLTLDDGDAQKLLLSLHMMEQDEGGGVTLRRTVPRHPMTRQCCRRAFLRGAFLGAGTMSDPEKDYHFELIAGEENLRQTLEKLLEKSGLPVQGCQQIADMLTLMGASKATMELENIRIKKGIRNQVNRAMNCDEKNAERQVSAAQKQVEMIKVISIQRGLFNLPPSLQEIARLRLEHPEESLTALGELLTPPVGKSGVNHRMRRLEAVYHEIEAAMNAQNKEEIP